jgi:hypothetical protein
MNSTYHEKERSPDGDYNIRHLEGPARALLKVATENPEAVDKALSAREFRSEIWENHVECDHITRKLASPEGAGFQPSPMVTLMISAARLRHVAGTKWGTRRYLTMELFNRQLEKELAIA